MAIKQAVDQNQMTLEEANEVILQQQKRKNEQLLKEVREGKKGFESLILDLKQKIKVRDDTGTGSVAGIRRSKSRGTNRTGANFFNMNKS